MTLPLFRSLLAVSALVSHNFIVPRFGITDERKKVFTARMVVIGGGFVAWSSHVTVTSRGRAPPAGRTKNSNKRLPQKDFIGV